MNARTAIITLLLGAAPFQAFAGEERVKWWQSDTVKADIGLSEAQSTEIERIFQSVLPQMRVEKEELDRQERALSKLMDGASAGEAEISLMVDRVESARAKASKTRLLMLYRMHQVLSPAQREKLDVVHSRQRGGRRGPG
ncbi:MAG: Spy/CpxP family protein refolding chaperone [Vicinamibacterales bacterium]